VTPTDRSLALGFVLSIAGAALTLATWHQLTRAPPGVGATPNDHVSRDPRLNSVPRGLGPGSATVGGAR
jgi:hypothetical protein